MGLRRDETRRRRLGQQRRGDNRKKLTGKTLVHIVALLRYLGSQIFHRSSKHRQGLVGGQSKGRGGVGRSVRRKGSLEG